MARLESPYFGTVQYEEESVFQFPAGLPGFEDQHRFVAIAQGSCNPLIFLHSLDRPELCFITLPALVVDPGYRLAIGREDLRELGLPEHRQPRIGAEVLCLAIVAAGDPPTVNLLAPIVVNLNSRRGVQAIQAGSGYSHRHALPLEQAASVL